MGAVTATVGRDWEAVAEPAGGMADELAGERSGDTALAPGEGPNGQAANLATVSGWAGTRAVRGLPGGPLGPAGSRPDMPGRLSQPPVRRQLRHLRRTPAPPPSAWQRAWHLWHEAGIAWQQPAGRGGSAPPEEVRPAAPEETAPAAPVPPAARPEPEPPARVPSQSGRARDRFHRSPLLVTGAALAAIAAVAVGVLAPGGAGQPPVGLLAGAITRTSAAGLSVPGAPGAPPSLTGLAGDGQTVVAFGAVPGIPSVRPVFLVSTDAGHSWRDAPAVGTPTGNRFPALAAGGAGRWLAIGRGSAWISSTGLRWNSVRPMAPMLTGDRVLSLARTADGFFAVGTNVAAAGRSVTHTGVVWTSADGTTWRRRTAAQLGLVTGRTHVSALRWVAVHAGSVMIAGVLTRTAGRRPGTRRSARVFTTPGLWRSADGGRRWARVVLPGRLGAGALAGIAAIGRGFLVVRDAGAGTGRLAVSYVCAAEGQCRRAGTLRLARAGFQATMVTGDGSAVAVAGFAGHRRVAFASTDGRRWQHTAELPAGTAVLSGMLPVTGGSVLVAGASYTPGGPAASRVRQPVLALARPGRSAGATALWTGAGAAAMAGESRPYAVVRSLATAAGWQVAVGNADGIPAIWTARPGSHWTLMNGLPVAGGAAPGLTGVVHGPAGWLAIGGAGTASVPGDGANTAVGPDRAGLPPQVLISADGQHWQVAAGSSAFGAPGIVANQAAAGPAGYVVVGEREQQGRPFAALWWSARLTKWTPLGWWTPSRAQGPSAVLAVTSDGGSFAAGGAIGAHAAAWLSPDGQRWTGASLALPPHAASAVLTRMAMSGRTVVGVGSWVPQGRPGDSSAFVAVSDDGGLRWREADLSGGGEPAAVTALTAVPGGYVAAGLIGPAGHQRVVFWWSRDALHWFMVRPARQVPGAGRVTAFSLDGSVLRAVGYEASGRSEQPVVWQVRVR